MTTPHGPATPPSAPDAFDTLGLKPSFDITGPEIRAAYLALSAAAHADGGNPESETEAASARLNAAKEALQDAETRANLVLARLGGPPASADRSLPDGFLATMMDARERAEDARAAARLAEVEALIAWAESQRDQHTDTVRTLLTTAASQPPAVREPSPSRRPPAAQCLALHRAHDRPTHRPSERGDQALIPIRPVARPTSSTCLAWGRFPTCPADPTSTKPASRGPAWRQSPTPARRRRFKPQGAPPCSLNSPPLLAPLPIPLAAVAILSGAETALFSLTYHDRLRLARTHPLAATQIAYLLARPRGLLVLILFLNMVASTIYFVLTSIALLRATEPWVAIAIGAVNLLAMTLVGEVVSKMLAARYAVPISRFIAGPLRAVYRLLQPVVEFVEAGIIAPLARLFIASPRQGRTDARRARTPCCTWAPRRARSTPTSSASSARSSVSRASASATS